MSVLSPPDSDEWTHPTLLIIQQKSLFIKLQESKTLYKIWTNSSKSAFSGCCRRHCCVSLCVPASEVHPALVVPIRHALGVHHLCEQTIPTWTTHRCSVNTSEPLPGSLPKPLSHRRIKKTIKELHHPDAQHTWNCLHYLLGHNLAFILR